MGNWTLFSNHGHVLLFLASDPEARLRDVAARVGITERAVQKIVRDLQDEGLLSVTKRGRRNRYRINTRKSLRHPLEAHRTVGNLVNLMRTGRLPDAPAESREAAAAGPAAASAEPGAPDSIESTPQAEPKPAVSPAAEARAEPEPEAVLQPEPKPEPEPEPIPEPEPAPGAPLRPGPKKKTAKRAARKKKGPPPDEGQGTLF